MKLLSKLFLAVLLLTVTSVSWAACAEGTKQTYKGCEPDLDFVKAIATDELLPLCLRTVVLNGSDTKYIDMPDHKAMAVNENRAVFSSSGNNEISAKKSAFSQCEDSFGSGCTISDVNGIQCRNAAEEKERAIEAERKRKEEQKRVAEAERKRKEEQKARAAEAERKRLEEEERKRAEAAEAERKRLEAEKKKREEAEKRKTYVLNNLKSAPLEEIEKFLLDYQSALDTSSIEDVVNEYFVRSRDKAIAGSDNIFRALWDVFSRAERIGIDLSGIVDAGIHIADISDAGKQDGYDFLVELNYGEKRVFADTSTGYCYIPEKDYYYVERISNGGCRLSTHKNITKEQYSRRNISSSTKAISFLGNSKMPSYLLPVRTTFQEAIGSEEAKNADYLIILNLMSAITDREITKSETVQSEYEYSTRRIPNQDYDRVRIDADRYCSQAERLEYQMDMCYANKPSSREVGIWAAFAATNRCYRMSKPKIKMMGKCREETEKLKNTPLTILEPIYQPYSFRKSKINIQKNVLINIYVVDKKNDSIVMAPFNGTDGVTGYLLVHGLQDKDRNYSKHKSNTSSDEELGEYESAPLEIHLSAVFDAFSVNSEEAQTLPDLDAVEEHILVSTTTLVEQEEKEETYTITPASEDARFTPVVVVLHPGGGIGSGFYVTEDIVLTNYHVIEGTSYLEVALFNGNETFGKVIAKDIRLDLALVKVQERGTPVTFYREKSLTLGGTVEAIGHPSGLEYSITRGAVSGIRRLPSRYDPGGKAIRFIQTDVAINPGNSGGPLYLDDKVVGVNTQKLVSEEIEGLSFAVHYSEVIRFLEKNGIK